MCFDELLEQAKFAEQYVEVVSFFRDEHTPTGILTLNSDGTVAKRLIICLSEPTQPEAESLKRAPIDSVNVAPSGSLNGSVVKSQA